MISRKNISLNVNSPQSPLERAMVLCERNDHVEDFTKRIESILTVQELEKPSPQNIMKKIDRETYQHILAATKAKLTALICHYMRLNPLERLTHQDNLDQNQLISKSYLDQNPLISKHYLNKYKVIGNLSLNEKLSLLRKLNVK